MSDVAEMVAWLRREIETDRAAALKATPGPWQVVNATDYGSATVDGPDALQDGGYDDTTKSRKRVMRPTTVIPQDVDYGPTVELVDAEHIARHDPQDVIADCDAKLAILDEHTTSHTVVDGFCVEEGGKCTHAGEEKCVICGQDGCRTVRLLAQSYRHRDGWREEWAT